MNRKTPVVAIVITTRNRREELRRALKSCVAQDFPNLEIRVNDDASDDDTIMMVRTKFPNVIATTTDSRCGYIELRNRGYSETNAEWVLSIDDDAYFTDASTVSRLAEQLGDPALGAVALPYLEPLPAERAVVSSRTTTVPSTVRSFVGTAHACRVEAFKKVGGYRELLVHQGEERDLCVRLFKAGYRIGMVDTPPLVHAVSPKRELGRMHRWGTRNLMLYDFFYTPGLLSVPVMLRHAWKATTYRFSPSREASTLRWLGSAVPDFWRFRRYRQPLSVAEYSDYMKLPSHGPRYVEVDALPPPCGSSASTWPS